MRKSEPKKLRKRLDPVKWSQKIGQLAKVYSTFLEGYEDVEALEFHRSV